MLRRYECCILYCLGIAVLLLIAGLSPRASAQSSEGSIVGAVRDASGAVMPDVLITIKDEERGAVRTTSTNASGEYVVPALQSGTYTVSAEKTGFRRAVVQKVVVEVNQKKLIDFALEVGQVNEEVTVQGEAATVESESSSLGQVVHSRQIIEMPLNGRNFIQLGLLASGVAALPEGGFSSVGSSVTNRKNTGLIIDGNREGGNSWLLDGIETRNPFTSIANLEPSIDAIQEFKIQRNNYAAEFGMGTGVVNIAIKSGTNQFHGSAYEFLRNDKLDARNVLDGSSIPPLRQNQWGGTIGGPIKKDRTYFFGSYESLREHRTLTLRSMFPDPAQVQGNYSAVKSPVLDPLTHAPFSGNIIPQQRLNPVAMNIAKYWPAPNVTGVPGVNQITNGLSQNDFDQFSARIDHRFSDKDQLFGRFTYSHSPNRMPGAAPYFGQFFPQEPRNLAISETHIFRPNLINDFRFGFNRAAMSSIFEPAPVNIESAVGLKNVDSLPPQTWGIPTSSIPGYFTGIVTGSLGPPTPNSQFDDARTFQFVDQLTWVRGRHTFKTGGDIRYTRERLANGIIVTGSYTYLGLYSGNPLGDFSLGLPFVFVGATGVADNNLRNTAFSGFWQDDFRVTPNLTLNFGLRYEYIQPPVDTQDRQGLWEGGKLYFLKDVISQLPPNLRPLAQVGGVSRGIVEPDRNNFAPRFGFAWRPFQDSKTVVRGGGGLFYTPEAGAAFGPQVPPFVNFDFLINGFGAPAFTLSDLLPSSSAPNTVNLFTQDRHNRTPYVEQWNLNIQRQLTSTMLFEIGYSGQAGHKLSKRHNANQPVPGTTPVASRTPYPQYGEVVYVSNEANSSYHGLTTRLDKSFSHGLSLLVAYTYSKSMDYDSGVLEAASTQNSYDRRAEHAVSDFDVPHRFVVSYVYELPFGPGKAFAHDVNGFGKAILGGWQLTGITTYSTGTPFYVTSATSTGGSTIFLVDRANRICDGNLPDGQRTANRWFDTSCFVDHPNGQFGNSGRNILRQDGRHLFDLSLIKNTKLSERTTLQFRTEFFNAFNQTNFARPNNSVTTPASFGIVTQNLTGPGRSREIQFGLKLLF